MITIDKVTYRNLQEQVQKNKEDIAAFEGVEFTLNNFGISVKGHVDSSSDIPSGTYDYGDAYLVGTEQPYRMFIYTRNKEGEDTGSFIDIGPLNIVGQTGEKGDKGDKGDDGYAPVVRVGTGLPIVLSSDKEGYLYIDSNTSKLYTFTDNKWTYACDMLGKKGDRGEQGIQGATGTSLSIVGKLSDPSLLPINFKTGSIPKNSAYLVTENSALHLYIILGDQDDYDTWYWQDVGDFNLGSMLYKDNNYMQTMNITDTYSGLTGALVTDTATSQLKNDVDTALALKEDKTTHDAEMLNKADKTTVSALSNVVTDLSNILNMEVNERKNADTTLTNNLSTETTNRIGGDSALETKISTEASTRLANDLPIMSTSAMNTSISVFGKTGTYKLGYSTAYCNDKICILSSWYYFSDISSTSVLNWGFKINLQDLPSNFTSTSTIGRCLVYSLTNFTDGYQGINCVLPARIYTEAGTKNIVISMEQPYTYIGGITNCMVYIDQLIFKYA